MTAFNFRSVPHLMVEWGAASTLGAILAVKFDARRLLVVTDQGLMNSGVLAPCLAALESAGFTISLFAEVQADPSELILRKCVAQAKAAECQLVLGLGGGSSLDVAKLAAVLAVSDQDLGGLYGIGKIVGVRLPLVQIPTTAGTGSESTNITILTTDAGVKMGVVADQLYADLVVLDGALTLGLPLLHTAATGIDAMVHAIEAYTSKINKNPLSDALAREALRLMSKHLLRACHHGQDQQAREAMLLGANLAGQAFANAPVAAVHALAYPLGGQFHIPHGLSNALMLVPVLAFNASVAGPLYAELADVVLPDIQGTTAEKANAFIDFMRGLCLQSGAPQQLREMGITQADLPSLAKDAMLQQRLLINNPVELTEADALRLYQQAW